MQDHSIHEPSKSALQLTRLWDDLMIWLCAGLIWAICLPTLILVGPATAMLWRLADWSTQGRSLTRRDIAQAWRSMPWQRSTLLWLSWLAPLLIGMVSLRWYATYLPATMTWALSLVGAVLWSSIGIQLCLQGLDLKRTIREIWSEAYRACVLQPRFVAMLWLCLTIFAVISLVLLPVLVLLPPWLAIWSTSHHQAYA